MIYKPDHILIKMVGKSGEGGMENSAWRTVSYINFAGYISTFIGMCRNHLYWSVLALLVQIWPLPSDHAKCVAQVQDVQHRLLAPTTCSSTIE